MATGTLKTTPINLNALHQTKRCLANLSFMFSTGKHYLEGEFVSRIKINTKANICNFGLPAFLFVANVPFNLYNI